MRTLLRRDLKTALKTRDQVAISALRSALTAIENAEAPPVDRLGPRPVESEHIAGSLVGPGAAEAERLHLTQPDLRAIVEAEMHERSAAAGEYEQIGRIDMAQRLRSEADVLGRYLPPAR